MNSFANLANGVREPVPCDERTPTASETYKCGIYCVPKALGVCDSECEAGTYSNENIKGICTVCSLGIYLETGASSCDACPEGTYLETPGGTSVDSCIKCSPGSYSKSAGATSISTCLPCSNGTYSGE
jgi:hypothetical protein